MKYLVLSLFPGVDLFGKAFEEEGFCVVRGPDIIYGQDVRNWSAIKGKFDVVIGGSPCQSHSSVSMGSSKEISLIPEFERIIFEAKPKAFVMENVTRAPIPNVEGYGIKDYILESWEYGANQYRKRRFSFGYHNPGLFGAFPFIPESPIQKEQREPDPFPTVLASEGKYPCNYAAGHKIGRMLTLDEVCELQGFPELANAWCFTTARKVYRKEFEYKLIGNGVEKKVGLVVARAIKNGLEYLDTLTKEEGSETSS